MDRKTGYKRFDPVKEVNSYLWRLERVVRGEVNGEEEDASLVRALRRAHDGGLPVEQILTHGTGRALRGGVATEVLELL